MAAKNIINLIELEKSANYLLESLGDILDVGGPRFSSARRELRRLLASGKLMEPETLKRYAFNLSNAVGEISGRSDAGSVEVKTEKPVGGSVEVKTEKPVGGSVEVRTGKPVGGSVEVRTEKPVGGSAAAGQNPPLPSPLADMLISLADNVASIRPQKHDRETQSLIKLIKSDAPLKDIVKNLLDLIIRIREDLWDERARAYKQIGEILKSLESTEKAFVDSVCASQAHLIENERDFTDAVETELKEIGDMVENGPGDLEDLCRRISQKISKLNDCVNLKKEAERSRLDRLAAEKEKAEQRLADSRRDYDEFSRQSREMLQELENLRAVSLRDPLTEAYNRRAYDSQIGKTLEAVRAGVLKTCGMAVFDIDHFRDFNNTYGHLAGDRVLAYVARLTRETLRSDDLIFRYGGDEFVILMPNVGLDDAATVAEKVRRNIAAVEFKLFKNNDLTVAITISMGVAELKPEDDAAGFFARADEAMYQAKASGRNRVGSGA